MRRSTRLFAQLEYAPLSSIIRRRVEVLSAQCSRAFLSLKRRGAIYKPLAFQQIPLQPHPSYPHQESIASEWRQPYVIFGSNDKQFPEPSTEHAYIILLAQAPSHQSQASTIYLQADHTLPVTNANLPLLPPAGREVSDTARVPVSRLHEPSVRGSLHTEAVNQLGDRAE